MTATLLPPSALKDIFTGILFCLLIIAVIYMIPLIGSFVWVILPMPVLFYRLKIGRIGGGIIMMASMGILMVVTKSIAFSTLYFGSLLLTGFFLGESIERHLSIDRIMLFSTAATLGICLCSLVFYLALQGTAVSQVLSGYVQQYQNLSTQLLKESTALYQEMEINPEAFKKAAFLFTVVLPAIFINSYLTMAWINILLIKRILKFKGILVQSIEELNQWRAPDKMIILLIAFSLFVFLFSGVLKYIAVNCLIILMFVYFFQGIAVVSYFFQKKKAPFALRFLLYILIAVQPLFLMLVVGLGLFDTWGNFRKIPIMQH